MGLLTGSVDGLGALGVRCSALGSDVGALSAAPSIPQLPAQATAAAVERVHLSVAAAGQAMADRLAATGAKLHAAGAALSSHEQSAATQLSLES